MFKIPSSGRMGYWVRRVCLVLVAMMLITTGNPISSTITGVNRVHSGKPEREASGLSLIPRGFLLNQGQYNARVLASGIGFDAAIHFTRTGILFSFPDSEAYAETAALPGNSDPQPPDKQITVSMVYMGASEHNTITTLGTEIGTVNYFLGDQPENWQRAVQVRAAVKYQQLYPGIDQITQRGNAGEDIEILYQVESGADPSQIKWHYQGDLSVQLDATMGDLSVMSSQGEILISEKAPQAWQTIAGEKVRVPIRFLQYPDNSLGFSVGTYDTSLPLVIDPTLEFSSYIGGSEWDEAYAITSDSHGNLFVAGYTHSNDMPGTEPASVTAAIFITKIDPKESDLIYTSIIGGTGEDVPKEIRVDSEDNLYVYGDTNSSDFPLVSPIQAVRSGSKEMVLFSLSPDGSALTFSTYLGGALDDYAFAMDIGGSTKITIAGTTSSTDFPVTIGAWDTLLDGAWDGVVAQIDAVSHEIIYSTYLGGSKSDVLRDLRVESDGRATIIGYTTSLDYPLVNAWQSIPGGGSCLLSDCSDAIITRLTPLGDGMIFSTYLGGAGSEYAYNLAIDAHQRIYVAGGTTANDFPLVNPLQAVSNGGSNGVELFISVFDDSASNLLFSTYLGGREDENSFGIGLDMDGSIILGINASTCIPYISHLPWTHGPSNLIVKLNPTKDDLDWYYLYTGSGPTMEYSNGFHIDANGNIYATGRTFTLDLPMVNAVDNIYAGSSEGYVFILDNAARLPDPRNSLSYLPMIQKPAETKGIYGYVTYFGCGLAGIALELRFYDGSQWTTLASTVSAVDGEFSFPDVPGLAPGQYYYVRYVNPENDPSRLSLWVTQALNTYTKGAEVLIGDFDLNNIVLKSPAAGSSASLPATFTWDWLPSRFENFEFNLFNPINLDQAWWTPPLGEVVNYVLTSLPTGFTYDTTYYWYVGNYSRDGGYGISYYAWAVRFTANKESSSVDAHDLGMIELTPPLIDQLNPIEEQFP